MAGLNSIINMAEESGNVKIELKMSRMQSRDQNVKNMKEAWESLPHNSSELPKEII